MAAAATIVKMPMKVVIFRPNHSKPPWIRLAPMDPLTLAPSVFFTITPQLSTADHFGVLRSRWKPRVGSGIDRVFKWKKFRKHAPKKVQRAWAMVMLAAKPSVPAKAW
uniref:Uncharacterized protein n=1 Tax=Anopheles coluzzii TaxID=1518534 RepID=A0A8W7P2A3_ANOCL